MEWIKQNKLAVILIAVVLILLAGRSPFYFLNNLATNTRSMSVGSYGAMPMADTVGISAPSMALKSEGIVTRYQEAAPAPEVADRMVVSKSYLSLVVKDVTSSIKQITDYVISVGGYMVNSNISRPEEGGTGTLTVRVPSKQLDIVLEQLKSKAVKVVSQNLEGTDVTDQYVDNQERLRILSSNKSRFEEIMKSAVTVDEILKVQNQIFSLQSQIDSIKGQQQYLVKTAEMAKITLYLSTDELSLPYAPVNTFRPEVVFKLAVRHLIGTLQSLASMLIWIGVYAVIWVPLLLVILIIKKRRKLVKPPSFK